MEETKMTSDNKAVIVTGAASGIGLAMTMGLLAAGNEVTAVDRNAAALAEIASKRRGCWEACRR
jgi:NADP-dependent 3-hydroxy acid dehydrogenase YdfG